MPGEERVNLGDQERLDAPDARALQALPYGYTREALGDLLGGGVGALSPPVWTLVADLATIEGSLSAFAYATRERTLLRAEPVVPLNNAVHAWETVVYSFDPAAAGHVNYPVNMTAARATAAGAGYNTRPLIWCRPLDIEAVTDTRRFWDVGTQSEVQIPFETRIQQRFEFAVADAEPAAGSGATWGPLARVYAWVDTGGGIYEPLIHSVSVWDSKDLYDWTESPASDNEVYDQSKNKLSAAIILDRMAVSSGALDTSHGLDAGFPPGKDRGMGIVAISHFLRRAIQRIFSLGYNDPAGTASKDWLDRPQYSLEGLRVRQEGLLTDVELLDAYSQENRGLIERQSETARVIASAVFQFVPAGAYSGVAEGWYVITGSGFYETVMNGGTWQAFYAKFKLPAAELSALEDYYISSIVTSIDKASLFGGDITSLDLTGNIQPQPGNPITYTRGKIGTHYKGAPVGVAAGEYAIPFSLWGARGEAAAPGAIIAIDPTTLTPGGTAPQPTFHVTVYASKYQPGEEIL